MSTSTFVTNVTTFAATTAIRRRKHDVSVALASHNMTCAESCARVYNFTFAIVWGRLYMKVKRRFRLLSQYVSYYLLLFLMQFMSRLHLSNAATFHNNNNAFLCMHYVCRFFLYIVGQWAFWLFLFITICLF